MASVYAFPRQRKEPLTDAQHVRNAFARFDQVIDVSDADCALPFANIESAAKTSWRDLRIHPQKKRNEKERGYDGYKRSDRGVMTATPQRKTR